MFACHALGELLVILQVAAATFQCTPSQPGLIAIYSYGSHIQVTVIEELTMIGALTYMHDDSKEVVKVICAITVV